jgi:polyisoprenoid-binding protein YceI
MKLTRLLLIPALVFAAADTTLDIAPRDAQVSFTLSDVLHTVHGTFALKRGNFRFDPETGKAFGEIVVDAASGQSGSQARDRRMHSNILESDRYPEIVFRPDRIEGKVAAEGASDAVLHGLFTIHGGDHELSAPVHIDAVGGRYAATAHFTVPYVKWGMKNPSTLILRVSDKVQIDVRLVAQVPLPTSAALPLR